MGPLLKGSSFVMYLLNFEDYSVIYQRLLDAMVHCPFFSMMDTCRFVSLSWGTTSMTGEKFGLCTSVIGSETLWILKNVFNEYS